MGIKAKISSIPLCIKVATVLVVLLLVVSLIARAASSSSAVPLQGKSNAEHIREFVTQSVRSYQQSMQDAHYVQALTHINQAISYINSARKIAKSDEEVQELTKVHPREWLNTLDEQQAKVIGKMQDQCPNPFTENPYMAHTGWTKKE